MTVTYNRKLKVYESDIIENASWPTRLDAEAAELPAELVSRAVDLAGSLKVAIKAARLVVDDKVKLDGSPDTYIVESKSHPDLPHTVDLAEGCTCEAFNHGIICSHWTAVLLLASGEDDKLAELEIRDAHTEASFHRADFMADIAPQPNCNDLIDELFGPPVAVRDAAGRVVFG